MEKGVTKGAVVECLQERLGITAENTMAFGDYDNDISMLKCAKYSYAMENASSRIKEQANFLAPAKTKNGVVETICQQLQIRLS